MLRVSGDVPRRVIPKKVTWTTGVSPDSQRLQVISMGLAYVQLGDVGPCLMYSSSRRLYSILIFVKSGRERKHCFMVIVFFPELVSSQLQGLWA